MRAYVLLAFLGLIAPVARANSITIGQFQFLGTNPQGISAFKVTLDTTGITAFPLILQNLMLIENSRAQSTGNITSPVTILFLGGSDFPMPACPCKSLQVDLFTPTDDKVFTLQLASGGVFMTSSRPRFLLRPLAGQKFLSAGQSASIVLTSVPEPGTLALFSGGLGLVFYWHRWKSGRQIGGQFGI